MAITFHSLFTSLAYCRDIARVVVDTNNGKYPIRVDDSLLFGSKINRYFSPPGISEEKLTEENRRTNKIFIRCVREFVGLKATQETNDLIAKLKVNKLTPLTAHRIRAAYKICIASFLEGFRKIAVTGRDTDRLIFDANINNFAVKNISIIDSLRHSSTEENKIALRTMKNALISEWGELRVTRSMVRHGINLDTMIQKGSALQITDINRLILGIGDYSIRDVEDCWKELQGIIKGEKDLSTIPKRTLRLLAKEFNLDPSDDAGITNELKNRCQNDADTPFKDIDSQVLFFLQRLILLDSNELELAFQGRRLEGLADGLQTGFSGFFINYPDQEDLARMQMYQMILNAKDTTHEDQIEPFYDEILTKGIVKKWLFEDMLVPSPWRDETSNAPHFYTVNRRLVTGYAKLGYYLTPIGTAPLKDILMYRSTSSAPSAVDALSTIITDLFPFDPPGYLWRHEGEEHEKYILKNSKRPLRVVGHSLGGSHSMLFLLNRIRRLEAGGFEDDLPERDFEIVTFDSPKIKLKCAKDFGEWLENESSRKLHGRISITHYTSTGDAAPFVGEALLGAEADPNKFKSLKVIELTPKRSHPDFGYHPHGRHFFRTEKNVDFRAKEIQINDTTCHRWHIIEIIRRVVGWIFFPLLFVYDALKKLIFGAGHYIDEEMSKLWRRVSPQQPVSTIV